RDLPCHRRGTAGWTGDGLGPPDGAASAWDRQKERRRRRTAGWTDLLPSPWDRWKNRRRLGAARRSGVGVGPLEERSAYRQRINGPL
ncbi:MAG: hypothetical protein ACQET1_11460, partial [Gemmatimonadota bacterium]